MERDIGLIICHGYVLDSLDNEHVICLKTFDNREHRQKLESIQTMTLADLHELASEGIQTAFNINIEKCRKENGGEGFASEIYVMVDVEDKKDEQQLTRINIPSEEIWEACKPLFGAAKGMVKVAYTFAVGRGTFLDRWFARRILRAAEIGKK